MSKKERYTIQLTGGQFVTYSIALRPNEPCYFVYFRGSDKQRLERSTGQRSLKAARERAAQLIQEEYAPVTQKCSITWDEAAAAMVKAMQANNNRPDTVDDYSNTLSVLRSFFPDTKGPAEITTALAKQFKAEYASSPFFRRKATAPPAEPVVKRRGRKRKERPAPTAHARKPRTVDSRIRKLRVIWSRWFIKELEYFTENPWKAVTPPRLEKLKPRYLTSEEIKAFFDWLNERWGGWRLPILFLTVKSFLGNRIGELCSLRSEQLQDGRIVFPADHTKGRAERKALLPPAIFEELKATAGPTYVWEAYPAQLQERSTAMGKPVTNLRSDFSPKRLQWFMQGEIADYCQAHPDVKRFSAHAFRKRAMTVAWQLDIPLEKAALAFGCNPTTMRAHYIALDETATADEVLSAIASVVKPIGVTALEPATEKKSSESALPQGDSAA